MKKKLSRFLCLVLCAALLCGMMPAVVASAAGVENIDRTNATRIYGKNRYQTAFAAADALKQIMGVDAFEAVVVACGSNFPDALSGSYLAYVKNAPILLANLETMVDVKEYIRENVKSGGTIYLLGGTAVLPQSMEAGLTDYNVVRLSGKTRYDTNLEILEEAGVADEDILICTGLEYADSLSASALKLPILLVNNSLTEKQKDFLDSLEDNQLYIVGGDNAVSKNLEKELSDYNFIGRFSGKTRYETSVMLAEHFIDNPETAVLAYGRNFPDGLCGGPLAISLNAPLILTQNGQEGIATNYTAEAGINQGVVLGGKSLISDETVVKVFGITTYTVTFDTNGGSSVAAQVVESGLTAKAPANPTKEGYSFAGWYTDKELTSAYDFKTPVTANLTLYASWEDAASEEQDVPADIAEYYGVDPDEYDSDSDGLSNYVEIYLTNTSPTMTDSDGDGVNDANEDADEDGLTNLAEIEMGTDPSDTDTDADGLTDADEVNVYDTDPCDYDTDDDTLCDGDEIMFKLNPNSATSDGVTPDAERTFVQELSEQNIDERLLVEDNGAIPSLILDAAGNINRYVSVDAASSNDFNDSRAIIGEALTINSAEDFEGTLSYNLEDGAVSYISPEDTDESFPTLLICKNNEDGSVEYLRTEYEEGVLSAEIDSQGTYFVLDIENLFDELGLSLPTVSDVAKLSDSKPAVLMSGGSVDVEKRSNDNGTAPTVLYSAGDASDVVAASTDSVKVTMASSGVMAQADIIFIIDTTGSMGDEIDNVKNNISYFVDALNDKGVSAALALIDYEDITVDGYDSTRVHKNGSSNWFYDVDDYKTAIANLTLGYGGDTPECAVDALETARLLDMRASAGKIFVLVTDANYKVDNRYDIPSMAAEIELLKNAGVNCSVVSPSYEQETYYALYTETNGIWADIYGDFYEELMGLADKIGNDIVGDGYWIYLNGPVPVPVRLDAMPEEGSNVDTDADGIPDIKELEGATPSGYVDLDELITIVSHGAITGTEYGIVRMYKYHSNPVEKDTDFDGIGDDEDADPDNNFFRGKTNRLKNNEVTASGSISFVVDYTDFFEDNAVYNKDIGVLSSLFAADIYGGKNGVYIEVTSGATLTGDHEPAKLLSLFGMGDVVTKDIGTDNDKTEVILGHRLVEYNGIQKDIVLLSVRGTNGTFAEWSSNFDVGADTAAYKSMVTNESEWKDPENHKGFDVTANRVKAYVDTYLAEKTDDSAETVLWITGHSRGAAIANILGALYTDAGMNTFVYTFAAPNTTTKDEKVTSTYSSVFNIVNSDDLIPYLPLSDWGFGKYGITKPYTVSVEAKYEDSSPFGNKAGTFEALLDMDYNNNSKIDKTLEAFLKVAKNREELYKYTYADDTMQLLEINRDTYSEAEADVEKAKQSINATMRQFCEFEVLEGENGFGSTVYRGACYQTPAYFMQVLALIAAESGKGIGDAVSALSGNAVADKYEGARNKFALIGNDITGGLNHPHWTESYYLITKNNFKDI